VPVLALVEVSVQVQEPAQGQVPKQAPIRHRRRHHHRSVEEQAPERVLVPPVLQPA
jgi:hypothetical protein